MTREQKRHLRRTVETVLGLLATINTMSRTGEDEEAIERLSFKGVQLIEGYIKILDSTDQLDELKAQLQDLEQKG